MFRVRSCFARSVPRPVPLDLPWLAVSLLLSPLSTSGRRGLGSAGSTFRLSQARATIKVPTPRRSTPAPTGPILAFPSNNLPVSAFSLLAGRRKRPHPTPLHSRPYGYGFAFPSKYILL